VGDREDRRSFPVVFSGSVLIVIVVSRVIVTVILVLVVAKVNVEVKESGTEFAVAVPVLGGVEAEAADADNGYDAQDRAGQPE
jgi:hypothetical protein